ncbi:MAG: biotin--[acetyl-CoA-carboxylase] ligase [Acidobacteria bacterium]|nr:MAG: biotin--[acetyl-CoA-carboxylase] ligase [Acidobacteriota bacterium]
MDREAPRGRSRNPRRVVYRIPSRSFARCFASSAGSAAPSNDDDRPRSLSLLQRRLHKRLRSPALRSWTQDCRRRSYHCGIANIGPRVLFPKAPPSLAPLFTLAAAVAMHNASEHYTGLDIDIKWPNDLLVEGKKFCGILSEIQAEVDLVKNMVIGIGVNVNHETLPPDIADRATSLRMASGRIQSRIEILLEFFEEFENIYMEFERRGPRSIIEQWTSFSSFATGRRIEIHDGVRKITGVTRGLNALGALRIEQKSGQLEDVYSGEVVSWE